MNDEKKVPVHLNYGGGRGEWTTWPESAIDELVRAADEAKARRAEQMPDDAAALRVLMDAHTRLRELGWSDAIYCPKDGTPFHAIEAGSTGIHICCYRGTWPNGVWWIADGDGDVWPSRPILWRAIPEPASVDTGERAQSGEE